MSVQKSDPTSVNLLARIQSGEKAAWHRLMTLYAPLIRFWCNQWGVAEIDLDDVIQEVWLVLGPRLGSYRPNAGCSFPHWSGSHTARPQEWYRRRSYQLAEAEGGSDAALHFQQIEDEIDTDALTDPGEIAESKALLSAGALAIARRVRRPDLEGVPGRRDRRAFRDRRGRRSGLTAAAVRMAKCRVLGRLRQELGELIE